MSENKKPEYNSVEELFDLLAKAYGHTFGELDVNRRLDTPKNKGKFGHIVEEGVFKYPINSSPKADFDKLGIELKVTAIRINKNKEVAAKERLSIKTIDYETLAKQDFDHSDLKEKMEKMLIVLYKFDDKIEEKDYKIKGSFLNIIKPEDLVVIKKDYANIRQYILDGKAEELHEGSTKYLVAATTGGKNEPLVQQPFSSVLAKKRRFAFKQSYLNEVIKEHIFHKEGMSFFGEDFAKYPFEYLINEKIKPYLGKSFSELKKTLNVEGNSLQDFNRLVSRMFGVKNINNAEEIKKGNYEVKAVRIEENGKMKESISFPYFNFTDIVEIKFEDSNFYCTLIQKTFIFFIFEHKNDDYYFKRICFYKIPEEIIETEGRKVFDELKKVLLSGNIVSGFKTYKNGNTVRLNNFPKMKNNYYFHIRPHGRDGNDVAILPVPDKLTGVKAYTKQCFWLHNQYLLDVLGYKNKKKK